MATVLNIPRTPRSMDSGVLGLTKRFTQVFYWAFLCAGPASATVSALAEYHVIDSFYKTHASVWKFTFAGILVFVLETAKLFLIFFNRQYSSIDDQKYVAVRPVFSAVRYALVFVSFFCMLVYTLYNLSSPEYSTRLAEVAGTFRATAQAEIARVDASYHQRGLEQFSRDSAAVEFWREKMVFEMNNVVGRTWEGAGFAGNKRRLDSAQIELSHNQEALEAARLEAIAAIEHRVKREVDSVAIALKSATASQNKMVGAALEVWNGGSTFSSGQYTLVVIAISLLLSLTLEAVMWAVFTVTAITYGDAFTNLLHSENLAESYVSASRASSKMSAADDEEFRDRVLRQKRSLLRALRDLLNRR